MNPKDQPDANGVTITAEVTPNPNTLKFNVNRALVETGSLNFPDREAARGSALAERLFGIEQVLGVMAGRDFVTVTKAPSAQWQALAPGVIEALKELLASGAPLFAAGVPHVPGPEGSHDTDVERRIQEILDREIRPAVAMDGGDIIFYGYENGVVTLHLQGSCSSCPSSVMTLKMGVENRLRAAVPEVREVVQV